MAVGADQYGQSGTHVVNADGPGDESFRTYMDLPLVPFRYGANYLTF